MHLLQLLLKTLLVALVGCVANGGHVTIDALAAVAVVHVLLFLRIELLLILILVVVHIISE